jgi:8-oxo-dGTP pyrophosphatase MutT (NUDIX family)
MSLSDSKWTSRLVGRANQPPRRPRDPLRLAPAGPTIGSIEPALAERLSGAGLPLCASSGAWHLTGAADASLAELAQGLHAQGLGGRWRNELLPVTDAAGQAVAVVERGAVRPLGITTHAVHMVGRTPEGAVWVQQRALDKATDPGLWDTMVGGLISAGESILQTLERETWEEAGLHVPALQAVVGFGQVTVQRPVIEGYMVERIHMFEAVVPADLTPANQDGEVARFERIDRATVRRLMQRDEFTLEAALVLLRWLEQRPAV